MKTKLKDLKGKKLSRSKIEVDYSGKHLLGMPSIDEEETNRKPSSWLDKKKRLTLTPLDTKSENEEINVNGLLKQMKNFVQSSRRASYREMAQNNCLDVDYIFITQNPSCSEKESELSV